MKQIRYMVERAPTMGKKVRWYLVRYDDGVLVHRRKASSRYGARKRAEQYAERMRDLGHDAAALVSDGDVIHVSVRQACGVVDV